MNLLQEIELGEKFAKFLTTELGLKEEQVVSWTLEFVVGSLMRTRTDKEVQEAISRHVRLTLEDAHQRGFRNGIVRGSTWRRAKN